MPGAARKELDSAGGPIIEGSPNVFVNNKAAVRVGDAVQPHDKNIHRSSVIAEGSPNVFVNGIPKSRQGDLANCGHPITPGSSDVFVN